MLNTGGNLTVMLANAHPEVRGYVQTLHFIINV